MRHDVTLTADAVGGLESLRCSCGADLSVFLPRHSTEEDVEKATRLHWDAVEAAQHA